uniref:Transposase (putative) gypsy type domain-containing protein n=1 Tax=Fagus sylvatica TaxID=28930 RepID=A0A2N9GNP9_FAGSY
MRSRRFRLRVTRVVMRLVGVLETSFRQILAINEKASHRAASDTCHHATGRRVRGVVSFAENGLGPPPIEGFVSPDSVLHRLSAELYSVIYPSISTWEAIRGRMAANEAEWPLPLSEELPEGLSDESAGGGEERGLIRRDDDIDRIRHRYQIPDDVVLRIPDPDEKACCPKYKGDVAFYKADLRAGLRFPIQPFVRELLDFLSLAPGQVNPNGWRTIISCMVMWRVNSNGEEDLTVDEFLFCYEPVQIALSQGFWTFKNRDANSRVVQGLPSSDRIWKDGYFFVCGDNWERLPQEDPRDFVGVRRSWGTPSSSALDRPLLNSVWQERILRILDIEDRRYNIFIEPDLLATFSLGPVPSSSVRALVKANKKCVDTMKLNKNRLKQLAQSGEVAAAPVSLKRKKTDEGSSKRVEEAPSRPSVPTVTPSVIPTAVPSVPKVPTVVMVDSDLTPPSDSSSATINQSPHVAMDKSERCYIFSRHGRVCLQGLTEAMVMGRRCASVEEDLAVLRAKSMADEAEMKNAKKAVMELTRERKEVLAEAEKLRKDLKARDDDEPKRPQCLSSGRLRLLKISTLATSCLALKPLGNKPSNASLVWTSPLFNLMDDTRTPVVDASQDQAGDEDVSSK